MIAVRIVAAALLLSSATIRAQPPADPPAEEETVAEPLPPADESNDQLEDEAPSDSQADEDSVQGDATDVPDDVAPEPAEADSMQGDAGTVSDDTAPASAGVDSVLSDAPAAPGDAAPAWILGRWCAPPAPYVRPNPVLALEMNADHSLVLHQGQGQYRFHWSILGVWRRDNVDLVVLWHTEEGQSERDDDETHAIWFERNSSRRLAAGTLEPC
jgi:hypothetical protein